MVKNDVNWEKKKKTERKEKEEKKVFHEKIKKNLQSREFFINFLRGEKFSQFFSALIKFSLFSVLSDSLV